MNRGKLENNDRKQLIKHHEKHSNTVPQKENDNPPQSNLEVIEFYNLIENSK